MHKKSRYSRKIRMHVPGVPGAMALGASGGRRRRQRGGSAEAQSAPAPAPYSDAASYVAANYGDGNTQWNNVFGPQSTSTMGNEIVNLNHPQMVQANVPQGGGRRRRGSRKGKRGGFLGNVVSQAIVPFGLLALQNKYSRRLRHKRGGSRKRKMKGGYQVGWADAGRGNGGLANTVTPNAKGDVGTPAMAYGALGAVANAR